MPKSLQDFIVDAKSRIAETDAKTVNQQLASNHSLLIVDVREPNEFQSGHIASALSIPRGTIEVAADAQFPMRNQRLNDARDKEVVVYCATGGRSAMAADVLQQMGYTKVKSLAGGVAAWKDADLALVS
ncbi:MAG: rhodanese-like domain-containing protein [Arenicellales bacterium WSBS_2016_MAG_OTU3]